MFAYTANNPINRWDPSGYIHSSTTIDFDSYTAEDHIKYKKRKKSKNKTKLDVKGEPNSVGREYLEDGRLKKERFYGPDGRVVRDRDYTDHGNDKKHPKVPHDHDWTWDNDTPTRGEWYSKTFSNPVKDVVKVTAYVGTGYIIYRGFRMLPSLLPPLWWTIPANVACP